MSNNIINIEKVYLLEKYKKKDFKSDIKYIKFCESINSEIERYNGSRTSLIVSDNKIKQTAARLGTYPEVLLDSETYNTLIVDGYGCTVSDICRARDMVTLYKEIMELRGCMSVHFDIYKPESNIDYSRITSDMINEYLLTHKYDSIYIDKWAMSMYYDNRLETVLKTIPTGIRIYYTSSDGKMTECICKRREYF